MPSEAVALDVTVLGDNSKNIDKVRETVQNSGFHPHPIDDEIIGDLINHQPFEYTDSNIDAVENCVNSIASQLPEADVSYEIRKNRDAGRTVEKVCSIRVDAETPEQKEEKEKRREELRGSWREYEVKEESKDIAKEIDWRDKNEVSQVDGMDESDVSKTGFHSPCEHCSSTVFRQEVTTTTYVECDEEGDLVDQETEHERNEVIYCDECGQKLTERTKV